MEESDFPLGSHLLGGTYDAAREAQAAAETSKVPDLHLLDIQPEDLGHEEEHNAIVHELLLERGLARDLRAS